MGVFAGIVGLPNVGKSTLFNTITNSQALIANYRFATIEPNFGIVNLPDLRLNTLKTLYNSKQIFPATFKFVDIAGLIAGASQGEGLGNKFLQNIREVDAICHVIRCFDDKSITHEYETVDPIRDAKIINLELAISDYEIVTKRIEKIRKKADSGDKESIKELSVLRALEEVLKQGQSAQTAQLSTDDLLLVKSLNLITLKPVLYAANISETDIVNPEENIYYQQFLSYAKEQQASVVPISIKLEYELSLLDEQSKQDFKQSLGIEYTGLDIVIKSIFKLLNLSTYFTCGPEEIHAWIFKNGMNAVECSGIIHTDFMKGFIKAEVISYEDLVACEGELKAKEKGKMRLEGKTYLMQDGDICHFKFNVTK